MYQLLNMQLIRVPLILLYVTVYFKLRSLGKLIPYGNKRLSLTLMSYMVLFIILKEFLRLLYIISPLVISLSLDNQWRFEIYIGSLSEAIEVIIYVTISLLALSFLRNIEIKISISEGYGLVTFFILTALIGWVVLSGFDTALIFYLKAFGLLVGFTLLLIFLFERSQKLPSRDSILKTSLFGDFLVLLSVSLLIIVYLFTIAGFPILELLNETSLLFALLVFGIYIDVFPPNILVSLMGGENIE